MKSEDAPRRAGARDVAREVRVPPQMIDIDQRPSQGSSAAPSMASHMSSASESSDRQERSAA